MANLPKKGVTNNAPGTSTSETGTLTSEVSKADIQFLNYLRVCGPQIISALQSRSSQYGELGNWVQMNEYRAIANTIADHIGLDNQLVMTQTLSRAAGAGR